MAIASTRGGSAFRAWWLAARIPTLPAAVVPVLVGTAAAVSADRARVHAPSVAVFVATLAAALLIQTGTNFANDVSDYLHGADNAERQGPRRGLQSGSITLRQLTAATIATFALALLIGLYLVHVGGMPILVLGLLSLASGVAYTGGPWPLGYHGLGDLFVFFFFGVFAVTGTAYLQMGAVGGVAVAASVPVGLLCTAILVVNNVRDVDTDRRAGKTTLVVWLGEQGGRAQYAVVVLVAYLVPVAMLVARAAGPPVLLPWLTLPLAVALIRTIYGERGPALNAVLKRTGQLHLLFGVLLAAGLLWT